MTEQKAIEVVRKWISEFVIGLNLCPFAKHPFSNDTINYLVVDYHTDSELLNVFDREVKNLGNNEISTSLIIIRTPHINFMEYLRVYELCEKSLEKSGEDSNLQLASFHPDYQFADSDYADQSNFTNRSPLPIIHLLRTEDVSAAIDTYGDTSAIYERNIETLNSLSIEDLNTYLRS